MQRANPRVPMEGVDCEATQSGDPHFVRCAGRRRAEAALCRAAKAEESAPDWIAAATTRTFTLEADLPCAILMALPERSSFNEMTTTR